jgi:hypothetical protein
VLPGTFQSFARIQMLPGLHGVAQLGFRNHTHQPVGGPAFFDEDFDGGEAAAAFRSVR